jgi:hypothetical protein
MVFVGEERLHGDHAIFRARTYFEIFYVNEK